MNINLIAAIDLNNGLGKNNELLCYLPKDLQHFKKITMGKPIIMGYNTFRSIGKALPGRRNIVLTSRKNLSVEGITFVANIKEALSFCDDCSDVMVIGGASIYQQFLAQANRLYLTIIDHVFDADVFFPTIDFNHWRKVSEERHEKNDKTAYGYSFKRYERNV